MHTPRWGHRFALSLLVCASLFTGALHAGSWAPIPPAELAAKSPTVDPEASAEILTHETTIDDSDPSGTMYDHYFRVKVFTKAGADKLAKVEINFDRNNSTVTGVEARTIKPDGTVLELKRDEMFEREVLKAGNLRLRVKSFAPPGVEPGAIVEYRYRMKLDGHHALFPLLFQSDSPARFVRFRFRPRAIGDPGWGLQVLYLNYPRQELKTGRNGFYEFTATNLPAFKEEPLQPPAVHLTTSVVLYYAFNASETADRYWARLSENLDRATKTTAKATKALTAQARRLVAADDSDAEKLRKLHDYCRAQIQNRSSDTSGLTPEQRRKLPTNEDAADTLKNASGWSDDINTLFVALARALGFDARLALANDRTVFVYIPTLGVPFAFTHRVAAVLAGGQWKYFDPGARYLPAGTLDWRHCDTSILIANAKGALIEPVKGAPAEHSMRHQVAQLAVDDNGVLEGDVNLDYTGNFEATEKNALDDAGTENVKKHLLAALELHLKGVEITDIKVEHAAQPLEPLKISFHLRVPEFAERTGSRLFIQPNIFRRGVKALFEAPTRQSSIVMPHRYQETDEISIALPEGASLEAGSAPPGLELGALGKFDISITWAAKSRVVHLQRDFTLNAIAFSADKYPTVKRIFEIIQERDDHTLTFRFGGGSDGAAPKTAEPEKTP